MLASRWGSPDRAGTVVTRSCIDSDDDSAVGRDDDAVIVGRVQRLASSVALRELAHVDSYADNFDVELALKIRTMSGDESVELSRIPVSRATGVEANVENGDVTRLKGGDSDL